MGRPPPQILSGGYWLGGYWPVTSLKVVSLGDVYVQEVRISARNFVFELNSIEFGRIFLRRALTTVGPNAFISGG